jgi:methylated-DNA-[protein]-cysteine S-methyltransferase
LVLYTTIKSPIGELLAVGDESRLSGLYMQDGLRPAAIHESWKVADEPFARLRNQLEEYFAGERVDFELRLAPAGTPFQQRVWRALREIPYAETATYGQLARRIARPTAYRAVGMANGRNPISIVVPCHRVVGADGRLTGYAGGLDRKRSLLKLEASALARGDAGPGEGLRVVGAGLVK